MCRAREEEEEVETRARSRIGGKVGGQHYDNWPRLPSEATWILHPFLPALLPQVLAPKEASETEGWRGDQRQTPRLYQGRSSPTYIGERPLGGGKSWCSLEIKKSHCPNMAPREHERRGGWHGSRANHSWPSYPEPEGPREGRGEDLQI